MDKQSGAQLPYIYIYDVTLGLGGDQYSLDPLPMAT
jgi:hypothetical protein